MIRDDKNKIIDEIRNLRTVVGDLVNAENEDEITKVQQQVDKIQDMVFGI